MTQTGTATRITRPGRTPRPNGVTVRVRLSQTDPDLPALVAAGLHTADGWSV